MSSPKEETNPGEYDIEYETVASRTMLEKRIPAELNKVKLAIVDIDRIRSWEPWRLALTIDLIDGIERNCDQLLETMSMDRLAAVAWIARNLLELLVWVKFCAASRENAWRFHEDALRDAKGLTDAHAKSCAATGLCDEISTMAAERLRQVAFDKLGLENMDSDFLAVWKAAKAPGVDLGDPFSASHKTYSKFAHPTAGFIHGFTHQSEACRQLQAVFTTQGVYFRRKAHPPWRRSSGYPPRRDRLSHREPAMYPG